MNTCQAIRTDDKPFCPHVVHICTTFNCRAGGMDRLFKRLRHVADNGYRITIVAGRDIALHPHWDMDGIALCRVPDLVKYIAPAKDLRALFALARLLKRLRPDVVHTHLAKAGILGRWAAWWADVPMIVHTVHGPTFPPTLPPHKRLVYRWAEWMTGKVTGTFVFVGEELRQDYIRSGVCSAENSTTIRTGRTDRELETIANLTAEEKAGLRSSLMPSRPHRFMVACVGRIVPSKAQDHAIRVIHALRNRGIDAGLVIVGEGLLKEEKSCEQRLKQLVSALALEKHVEFTGHRADCLQIMSAVDAILHTSRYEGLPNVLVEAALTAKPVVTYAVSGAREVIRDGRTGFIVPQGSIAGAVEKLFLLAADPKMAAAMGRMAFASICAEYRESVMIRKELALYRQLFRRQPGHHQFASDPAKEKSHALIF